MIKKVWNKILHFACSPIRRAVEVELEKFKIDQTRDIGLELQRRATTSSTDYVEERMNGVDSVTSDLELLTQAAKSADLTEGRLVCEFGVCRGRSINHIASLTSLIVYGFDSFEGLPERWRDGYSEGMFRTGVMPEVRENVSLVKGLFDASLPNFARQHTEPVAFLHIDCDLYSSTKTVFDFLGGQIDPGCVIVFDEYFNYHGWKEGEWKAFQEFVSEHDLGYEYIGYNRLNEQVAVKITGRDQAGNPERKV